MNSLVICDCPPPSLTYYCQVSVNYFTCLGTEPSAALNVKKDLMSTDAVNGSQFESFWERLGQNELGQRKLNDR
ncbi:hypothetical protein GVN20_21915 [Runella sp. CRIBMP]|uniref:hypothetical protein n=1 Tax=Runella sp. CRIBMP TaxID=2683261 RepID=UPI00141222F2|nr:hypothetical protein [Runella sp. CRIBMP]NBB22028.1 hypothetical protein [Runella sp. CRIBMP]